MNRSNYDNGLPFSEPLEQNLNDLVRRVAVENKAAMIVIDGGVGEGKTTFSILIGDYCGGAYKKIGGKYVMVKAGLIDFKKQLAVGGFEFIKRMKEAFKENLHVVIYDEAGDFNRRGALTRFNAMLNRIFETYRAFKILVILALPSLDSLDAEILDKGIPRMLIHCYGRKEGYGKFKAYSLYRMYYLKHLMKKLVVKKHAYNLVDANFHGQFLNLPLERAGELEKISTGGKLDIAEYAEIKFENLVTYWDVAKQLNRSVVWARLKMNLLKLKPKKIYKKRMFFEPYVIDVLSHEIEKESGGDKNVRKEKR